MIDGETKERLDELEKIANSGRYITTYEAVQIMFAILIVLFALAVALLIVFWDELCARIVLNALRQGVEALPPGR